MDRETCSMVKANNTTDIAVTHVSTCIQTDSVHPCGNPRPFVLSGNIQGTTPFGSRHETRVLRFIQSKMGRPISWPPSKTQALKRWRSSAPVSNKSTDLLCAKWGHVKVKIFLPNPCASISSSRPDYKMRDFLSTSDRQQCKNLNDQSQNSVRSLWVDPQESAKETPFSIEN